MLTENDEEIFKLIDNKAQEIQNIRQRPLLVMYYDDVACEIEHDDVRDLYDEIRERGASKENKVTEKLDVLLHTYGGDPDASYRLAQVIRDFNKDVCFLIPFHATSGGTLICLCGNEIWLGAYATLGPIDITIDSIEVASIDYFRLFATHCREMIEDLLKKRGLEEHRDTNVDSELLVEMVRQVKALDIGTLYRNSDLTGHYARKLMEDYMFANASNKKILARDIADKLLRGFPSHSFVMDFHICQDLQLPVKEMGEQLSDLTKDLVLEIDRAAQRQIVCKILGERHGRTYKAPFFRLYV